MFGQQAPAAIDARRGFFLVISVLKRSLGRLRAFHSFLEPSQQAAWPVGSEMKFNNSMFELYELYELYEPSFLGRRRPALLG